MRYLKMSKTHRGGSEDLETTRLLYKTPTLLLKTARLGTEKWEVWKIHFFVEMAEDCLSVIPQKKFIQLIQTALWLKSYESNENWQINNSGQTSCKQSKKSNQYAPEMFISL